MIWLAIVFVWFGATVLRSDPHRFAFGAVAAGFTTLAALNVLSPDAFIAQLNLDRPPAARAVDVPYLSSLSGDSVPVPIRSLASLPEIDRRMVAGRLLDRWRPPVDRDCHTFNAGHDAAWGGSQPPSERARARSWQMKVPANASTVVW